MGMPQHMETDYRADTCALAAVTHRAQLLGALPPAAVIAFEQNSPGERPAIRRSIKSGASPVRVTWRTCPLFASRIVSVSTSAL